MKLILTILACIPFLLQAQNIGVKSATKWVDGKNGFKATNNSLLLGRSHCNLGDVDGDGNNDIGLITNTRLGSPYIHVVFMEDDGSIRDQSIIEPGKGDFTGDVNSSMIYVSVICAMGDLNTDGIPDMAVSFTRTREIYIIFLNKDGSLQSFSRLADGKNGLNLNLDKDSDFGTSIYGESDFDQDGVNDLVVGDSESSYGHGSVYVLYLSKEGKVKGQKRIQKDAAWGYNQSGFTDLFGNSLTSIKDINGDGIDELIVGGRGDSHFDAGSVPKNGSLYCLFLKDNQVDSVIRLRSYDFGYNDSLSHYSSFAQSVANVGDLDGNSYDDLIVGITNDSVCGNYYGSAVILYMKAGFTVDTTLTLACWTEGMQFKPIGTTSYNFGYSVAGLGDINGDGMLDVSVGALEDGEADEFAGALFIISLEGKKFVSTAKAKAITANIFPNPASQSFQIQTNQATKVKVLNTIGQVLWQGQANGSISIDASQWKPGMYLVQLQENNGIITTQKLIVQ